jgi:hypothetical protein
MSPEVEKLNNARITLTEFPVEGSDGDRLSFIRMYLNQPLLYYILEGDRRLDIVYKDEERNKYNLPILLDPSKKAALLCSCTGNPITVQQADVATSLLLHLKKLGDKSQTYQEFYRDYCASNAQRQTEFVVLLGLDAETTYWKEDQSGTEAEHNINMVALAKARKKGKNSRVVSIIPKGVTGSASPKSVSGKESCNRTWLGKTHNGASSEEVKIEGYPDIDLVQIPIIDDNEELITQEVLDEQIYSLVKNAVEADNVPAMRITLDTKFGTQFGSLKLVKRLHDDFGDNVVIGIDDCQRRASGEMLNTLIHVYNCVVITTGSKALAGGMFYAITLMNEKNASLLNDPDSLFPVGLNKYTCKSDCGPKMQGLAQKITTEIPNIPAYLKRETALYTLRKLQKLHIPFERQTLVAHYLGRLLYEHVFKRSNYIQPFFFDPSIFTLDWILTSLAIGQGEFNERGLMHGHSIFSFRPTFLDGLPMTEKRADALHRLLSIDISKFAQVKLQEETDFEWAEIEFFIGQKVKTTRIPNTEKDYNTVLRLAISQLDVAILARDENWLSSQKSVEYIYMYTEFTRKLDFIIEYFQELVDYYKI